MSNKKSLLAENTIRRFMKLASIEPLAETFVEKNIMEDEEEIEEGGMPGAVYDREPDLELEPGLPDPEGEMPDPEGEEGLDPEAAAGDALTALMNKIQVAVEDVASEFGVDLGMEVDAGEEEGGDLEGDLEMEVPLDDPMGADPALEETETPSEDPVEEAVEEDPVEENRTELTEEEILEKITQKVSQRLTQKQELKEARDNKLNKLTNTIVERIFSSVKK